MDLKKLKVESRGLEPVVIIGKQGINDSVISHIKHVLKKKKLIKIKLSRGYLDSQLDSGKSRKEIALNIAELTNTILIDSVGLTVSLGRKR
jgi:RNA-binding protein